MSDSDIQLINFHKANTRVGPLFKILEEANKFDKKNPYTQNSNSLNTEHVETQ